MTLTPRVLAAMAIGGVAVAIMALASWVAGPFEIARGVRASTRPPISPPVVTSPR